MQNSMEVPLKKTNKLKIKTPYDSAIPHQSMYPEKNMMQKDTHTLMFTEALFIIAKMWKQHKCPLRDEWIKKMQYIYTIEYYSAIIKNEIMPFAATGMDLEIVVLSEVSQKKKNMYDTAYMQKKSYK